MLKKLTLLAAGGVGYVLGTRAGRERYEQIKASASKVASDPRVRAKTKEAGDLVKDKAPVVKDKVTGSAGGAKKSGKDKSSFGTESDMTNTVPSTVPTTSPTGMPATDATDVPTTGPTGVDPSTSTPYPSS